MENHYIVYNQSAIMDPQIGASVQYIGEPHTTAPYMDVHQAGNSGFDAELCHPAVVPDTAVQNVFTGAQWPDNTAQFNAGEGAEFLNAGVSSPSPVPSAEDLSFTLPPTPLEESFFDFLDFLNDASPQAKRPRVEQTDDHEIQNQYHQDATYAADTVQQPASSQVFFPKQELPPVTYPPAPVQNSVTYSVLAEGVGPISISYNLPLEKPPSYKCRKVQCHICDKWLESKYKLSLHMNSHTGNRPFVCEVCGKGFMRGPTLNSHLLVHKKPELKCPHCNRSFKRQPERLMHILLQVCFKQTEFRLTPAGFVCDRCGESLASRELVQEHCRQKHKKPQRLCPVCGEDFTHQRGFKLLAHARAAHPDYVRSLENSNSQA